jgi:hypothetical protein
MSELHQTYIRVENITNLGYFWVRFLLNFGSFLGRRKVGVTLDLHRTYIGVGNFGFCGHFWLNFGVWFFGFGAAKIRQRFRFYE